MRTFNHHTGKRTRRVRPTELARVVRKLFHLCLNFPKYSSRRFEETFRRIVHYCSVLKSVDLAELDWYASYFEARIQYSEDILHDSFIQNVFNQHQSGIVCPVYLSLGPEDIISTSYIDFSHQLPGIHPTVNYAKRGQDSSLGKAKSGVSKSQVKKAKSENLRKIANDISHHDIQANVKRRLGIATSIAKTASDNDCSQPCDDASLTDVQDPLELYVNSPPLQLFQGYDLGALDNVLRSDPDLLLRCAGVNQYYSYPIRIPYSIYKLNKDVNTKEDMIKVIKECHRLKYPCISVMKNWKIPSTMKLNCSYCFSSCPGLHAPPQFIDVCSTFLSHVNSPPVSAKRRH